MSLSVEIDDSDKPLTEKIPEPPQIVPTKLQTPEKQTLEIKVYKRRWVPLLLFMFYVWGSTAQWIQYSIVSNIMSRYYNVSTLLIDMTSITFMACYIPFILPATYLTDRLGLRWTVIFGSLLSCFGSWIKVFSVAQDRFWVTFLGQSLVASAQVFILNVPAQLASHWFGPLQVSTATALCLFGTQMGIATGFLASPMLVENHKDLALVEDDLSVLFRTFAIITTISAVLIVLFFQEEPPLPPSKTRAIQKSTRRESDESFIEPIKRLLTNKCFLILCNSYGFGIGVLNALATLLNQMVLMHFENGEKDSGKIGLFLTLMGVVGAVTFGIIIDKTHKFKETAVAVYFLTLCGQIWFAIVMMLEIKWMVYVSSMFLGFFLAGYLSLGYVLCVEYTYPESEDIAAGLLNIMNNIYGIVFVLGLGKLIEIYGDLAAHIGLCSCLFVGFIMTLLTKDEQRRYRTVQRENQTVS